MNRSHALLFVSLPFFAAVIHCTTNGLDALGAGDPATPTVDASSNDAHTSTGIDASGQGSEDSGTDAGTPSGNDASTGTLDASIDAPVDTGPVAPLSAPPTWLDGGTSSWCDLHPGYTFCADFDKSPLPAGFSASDGDYLAETSSVSSSSPNDLLLYVPPQTTAGTWGSKLSHPFTTPVTQITLAFDVYPEDIDPTASGLLFAALDMTNNAASKYSLRLAYNEGAPRLEESTLGATSDIYHANFALTVGVWQRVEVDITLPSLTGDGGADAGAPMESVLVNGLLQNTPEALTPPVGFEPEPTLLIGAVYGTSPNPAWGVRYDNITLTLN